mgnify:CR=1 FL=1
MSINARDLAEGAGLSGPQVGEAVRKARIAAMATAALRSCIGACNCGMGTSN